MTKEQMKTDLENNIKEVENFLDEAKNSFIGPEKLVNISSKLDSLKINTILKCSKIQDAKKND